MATIIVPRLMPHPLVKQRRARNGRMPHHVDGLGVGKRVNWYACHGVRKVHQDSGIPNAYAPGTGTFEVRRGAFHSSETPGKLELVARCAVKVNQQFRLVVNDGVGDTASAYVSRQSSASSAASNEFDSLAQLEARVELVADTAYTWRIDQQTIVYSGPTIVPIQPVLACNVFERAPASVTTSSTYVADTSKVFSKGPIYDADMSKLVQAMHQQWKHGPQLVSLSSQSESDQWTTTSATDVNMLLASASTTVSATTPGFNLPLAYLAPYHTTDIRAVFAVHARQDAGTAANSVKLVDSGGTLGTLSNFSNSAYEWKTVAVTLTGGAVQKVDLHVACDGTNTLLVDAVALYVKES